MVKIFVFKTKDKGSSPFFLVLVRNVNFIMFVVYSQVVRQCILTAWSQVRILLHQKFLILKQIMFYLNIYLFLFFCVFFSLYFFFINEFIYLLFKPYLFITQNNIFLYKKLIDIFVLKYQLIFFLFFFTTIPFFVCLLFYSFKNMLCVKHNIFLKRILTFQIYIYILFHIFIFILSFFLITYLLIPTFTQSNQILSFRFELFLSDFFYFYWYIYFYAFLFYIFCCLQAYYYIQNYNYFLYNKFLFVCVYLILFFSVWTPLGDITGNMILPLLISIYMLNLCLFYLIFNFVALYLLKFYKYLTIF